MDQNSSQQTPELEEDRKAESKAPESLPRPPERAIHTGGGAVVQGDVRIEGGDFVGRDKIIHTEETAYDVRGLPNPYLGLRAFGYQDRAAFGGRESTIREAVDKLTDPRSRQTLLFITGASGSGKSSLAQAGLLPALEAHYQERRKRIARAVFRPSSDPLAMLADAISLLGLPELSSQELARFTPDEFARLLSENTPKEQVNLLVIDQFEEFFTQSAPNRLHMAFAFLANLPDFTRARTHVISTLRSDFLDELFNHKALWEIAKVGIELRVMSPEELVQAIQQPLFTACTGEENGRMADERYCQKRFDPVLLEKLAQDASHEAAHLPLLQVTLQELWNKGSLRLSEYTSLTEAIQQRAEVIYQFEDYQAGSPQKERPAEDQAAILSLFLDLVDVALDDDTRRDVRRRRPKSDLIGGSNQRQRLVGDLVEARLLSAATEACLEGHTETVDIIHESLILNWDRLRKAIIEHRNTLQRRARFEMQLSEWLGSNRSDDYTLTGIRLAEARHLEKEADIALRREEAKDFLRRSNELVEAAQRRELQQARALAEAEHRRVRVARGFTVGLSIVLVLAIFAAGYALWQRNRAIDEQKLSQARELAAVSITLSDPELALNLALQSIDNSRTMQGEDALRRALLSPPVALTLYGHSGTVYHVEYDGAGKRLVTSGADGTARIWDAATGEELARLDGHDDSVYAAAFSPDGRLVATAGADKTILLWNAEDGRQLRSIGRHEESINSVAFSPDGRTIITASDDTTARVWEVETGRQVYSLPHTMQVRDAVFSPQGNFIATGGYDRTISIWDSATGELSSSLLNGSESINAIVYSPDGQYLYADWQYGAYRWNVQYSQPEYLYDGGHTWYLTDIAINPHVKLIATASRDHSVRLWSDESSIEIVVIRGQGDTINSIAFDPAGAYLATASAGGTVRIWDIDEWRKHVLIGHSDYIYDAAYSRDSERIATVSRDGTVRIWEAASGRELMKWDYPEDYAVRVDFHPDGRQVLTASDDGTWRIWDASTGEQLYQSEYTNLVHSARYNQDGTRIITTDRDGLGYIWDAETHQLIARLEGHTDWIAYGMFSLDGRLAVTSSADGTVRLWDAQSGEELRTLSGHTELVAKAAFSSNGKRIVTASVDGTARIWDTATGETLQILKGHTAQVSDAVFSPDDRLVVTASADNTVRLWDATTGSEIIILFGHINSLRSVMFSGDGRYLLTSSIDGTARIYPVHFGDVEAQARSILSSRQLTCAERVKYLHEDEVCPPASQTVSPEP